MRRRFVLPVVLAALAGAVPAHAVDRGPQEPYWRVSLPGLVRVRFLQGAPEAEVQALLGRLRLAVVRRGGEYWVVRAQSPADVPQVLRALNASPYVEWAVPHDAVVRLREPPTPVRPQQP